LKPHRADHDRCGDRRAKHGRRGSDLGNVDEDAWPESAASESTLVITVKASPGARPDPLVRRRVEEVTGDVLIDPRIESRDERIAHRPVVENDIGPQFARWTGVTWTM
jgi:hypothetical protein